MIGKIFAGLGIVGLSCWVMCILFVAWAFLTAGSED